MDVRQVLETYDEEYARTYNQRFLLDQNGKLRPVVRHELKLLKQLVDRKGRWLDVACGTGFFLSKFRGFPRAGWDLSPAMLKIAQGANPDALFFLEGDFREEHPEWVDSWTLVTCMWYAYCLVESLAQVELLVRNFARWTSPKGTCFVPLCDPTILAPGLNLPYVNQDGVLGETLLITGVTWSWIEASGKRHENLVAPQVEYMVSLFERYFEDVEIVAYPLYKPGRGPERKAVIARCKIGH